METPSQTSVVRAVIDWKLVVGEVQVVLKSCSKVTPSRISQSSSLAGQHDALARRQRQLA